MSKHRFIVVANVIDELLDEHDGQDRPPPNDVADWEGSDLLDAFDLNIVDEIEVETYDGEAHRR